MKKLLFLGLFFSTSFYSFSQGQFKVRNDAFIQIGYTGYKVLSFGQGTGTPNNGNFAIEHCTGCTPIGLNIWKPYPTANWGNYLLFIRDNGNIGVGNTGDASNRMWISGNLKVNATVYTSDKRFKENINPIKSSLNELLGIRTYSYNFIKQNIKPGDSLSVNVNKENEVNYNFDDKLHFGFLAQEIQKSYPNLVSEDEKGYLSLNYTEFIPLIINAMQEQNAKIIKLEQEIERLKQKK
jgi:hypothetical protein